MIMMIVEKEDGVDLEAAIENVLMIIQDLEDDQEVGHHDVDKSIGPCQYRIGLGNRSVWPFEFIHTYGLFLYSLFPAFEIKPIFPN